MALRCTLFGHIYDDSTTRRDREVRGDEVVTVVRTVERCAICTAERVVSENKEIVSVVDEGELETEQGEHLEAAPAGEPEPEEPEEMEPTTEPPGGATTPSQFDAADMNGGTQGAEILPGTEEPPRAPGQWPGDPEASDEPWEPSELGGGPGTEPTPDPDQPEPAPVNPAPDRIAGVGNTTVTLRCPVCEAAIDSENAYRDGDACPECVEGYLTAEE